MTNMDWMENEKLHDAVQDNNLEEVKRLLKEGLNPNVFDDLSKTALHYAVENENFEMITLLLENGADVNAHEISKIGDTPLNNVAETCSLKLAEMLIQAGADPTIPGWMGLTAIHKASKRKKPEGVVVFHLLKNSRI